MREEVLTELYALKPDTRAQVISTAGYAVFANANVNLILASFGGGLGVVRDNKTGMETFMRMGDVGIGLGAGIKDSRAVFVFHDRAALERFLDVGVSIGGQADFAAKAGDLGAAVSGEAIMDKVTVCQLTQSGLAGDHQRHEILARPVTQRGLIGQSVGNDCKFSPGLIV